MNLDLTGKVALVTGASRGIGASIAQTLAKQGATVIITGRQIALLDAVAKSISQAGGKAHIITANLLEESECISLIKKASELTGKIDFLINNAGFGIFEPLEKTSVETWDLIMASNTRAPFILSREIIQHLRSNGGGAIVNIASVVGQKGYVNQAAYTASKHALMGMSKVLGKELQNDNIRVHAICPGGVDTEMVAASRPDLDRNALIKTQEIAETVLFLLTRTSGVIDQIDIHRNSSTPWA